MKHDDRERMTRREFLHGESATDPRHFGEHSGNRHSQVWRSQYSTHIGESTGNNANARRFSWHQDQNGLYRGKGPRSYQRSDDRILEDINDRLCDNPYIDASEIDVEVANGEVILTGSVNDRESKRLAEDIGDTVSGVKNVENRLRVKKAGI